MHGLAQRVIFHEDDARQPIAMAREVSEGNVPDGERDQPVGEARRALEPHRLPGRERAGELRCARRLDAPHARRAVRRRQPDHDSRDQPASADRHHDRLDLGQLRGDLEPHGRLPATMSGSSNGGTTASPSRVAISSAFTCRSCDVRPATTTSPPHFLTPATLTAGAVSGITTTERIPSSWAAYATAWP